MDKNVWLAINEYSFTNKISISTIRRKIKNGKLISKLENGKYFIKTELVEPEVDNLIQKEDRSFSLEVSKLKQQIKILEEDNLELKMLVDILENNNQNVDVFNRLPDLPDML